MPFTPKAVDQQTPYAPSEKSSYMKTMELNESNASIKSYEQEG